MEQALNLRLKDDDPWKVTKIAYDIIAAYLQQPDTSASDTVTALDSLSPGKRKLEEGEKLEEPASFRLEFWECFLHIAEQVPFDHPGQEWLLALVQGLEKLPPSATEGEVPGKTIWTHLPELENSVQFIFKHPSNTEDTFEPYQEYINLNSFVARLVGTGLLENCWYFGIWAMRWAFEESHEYSTDLVTCRFMTSSQWIQHSGQVLFDQMWEDASKLDRRRYSSPLFKDGKVFSFDRWYFWKMKLSEANLYDIPEEVKEAAVRAYRDMNEI